MELKKYINLRTLLILAIIILTSQLLLKFQNILFILVLISLNWGLSYLKRQVFKRIRVGGAFYIRHLSNAIEMVTFSTIVASYYFGVSSGAIVGLLSILGTYIFEQRISRFSLVTIPLYVGIGALAHSFNFLDIFLVGIAGSILYNIVVDVMIMLFLSARVSKVLIFSIANILFNAYLFNQLTWILGK